MPATETTEFFTRTSILSFGTATVAVVVGTNTLRRVFGIRGIWLPFALALVVAGVALTSSDRPLQGLDYLIAFLNACLLFSAATGANQTASAARTRRALGAQPQGAKPTRWLESWLS